MSFFLKDRIKETSRSTGTGDFTLDGAAPGFSAFGDYYSDGDTFFYAITDGQAYEVGSGVYNAGGTNTLTRFPIQSTNSDLAVAFTAGLKEIFVTYPAKGSVYSAESHDHNQQPADSGVAFYSSNQIVNYDRMIIWDSGKSSLGIGQQTPHYAIDVGGEIDYSIVRASGFLDGGSGVLFSGVTGSFSGGRQLEPFLRNVTNSETGSDAVIKLSGVVDQGILLHKQLPSTIFAGPLGSCGCVDDYPTFRLLDIDDLPLSDINDRYVRQANVGLDGQSNNVGNGAFRAGSVALYSASGYITYDSGIIYDAVNNRLLLRDHATLDNPRVTLDVDGDIYTTNMQASGYVRVSGDISTSGLIAPDKGLKLVDFTPSNTSQMLYNNGGSIYWDGSALGFNFNVSDGFQPDDAILDTETLTVSGVSGVEVRYNANDNIFRIGASGLSGVLQEQIDNLSIAGYSFNMTDGLSAPDTILNNDTVMITGVDGVDVSYASATNVFELGASELSGVLQSQIDQHEDALSNEFGLIDVSGISGIAVYASGWIDNFNPTSNSIDATSGVTKTDSHYLLDQYGSGILKRLSLIDDGATILGASGGHGTQNYTHGCFIGPKSSQYSYNSDCSISIGFNASSYASGIVNSISIGCDAAYQATDSAKAIAIGREVISEGSGLADCVFIGNRAGAAASGTTGNLLLNDSIGIGNRSLENSQNSSRRNISIGNLSCRFAKDSISGIYFGNAAGTNSVDTTSSIYIGNVAGNDTAHGNRTIAIGQASNSDSHEISYSIFMGHLAGLETSGNVLINKPFEDTIGIGRNALERSEHLSECIAIGKLAGRQSKDNNNCIYIGTIAGSGREERNGDIIFSNTPTPPAAYNPTFGTGNGKNGLGWSGATDDIIEISTAVQGYINDLEDDDNRDVRLHIGHPLNTQSQLKATIQPQRTSPADYHIYLENSGTAPSSTEEEVDMAIADSPLKDVVAGEDGIPFVGPSGFMRVPWCVRTGSDELLYNGVQVPHIDGTIVGWMDSDTGPTNFGWAIGFFKGLPPMLGVSDGWVFHTGVKLP